jgi:hypothetical protein
LDSVDAIFAGAGSGTSVGLNIGSGKTLTVAGTLTNSAGTANGVAYLNGSKALTTGSAVTYNGTTFSTTADASISGLTVGKGGGAVVTNTAIGNASLGVNTSGTNNFGGGYGALFKNTTGGYNTAVGGQDVGGLPVLYSNVSGNYNTGVGAGALATNTASNNTAVGYQAGYSNTTGGGFIAVGYQAAYANTTGNFNIAIGQNALQTNTTGAYNVAVGYQALYGVNNATGQNVGVGWATGYSLNSGTNNTFIGHSAGYYVSSGSKNSILGNYSGNQGGLDIRTASNYIVLSDGDGNPLISTNSTRSVALNGAVPQTGTGITFPATQSASSDANTLDDYEEGTWTPTQGGGLTVVGTFSSGGNYTKIGRMVYLAGYVSGTTSVTAAAAAVFVGGLPFGAITGPQQPGVGIVAPTNSGGFVLAYSTTMYAVTAFSTTTYFFNVAYQV